MSRWRRKKANHRISRVIDNLSNNLEGWDFQVHTLNRSFPPQHLRAWRMLKNFVKFLPKQNQCLYRDIR